MRSRTLLFGSLVSLVLFSCKKDIATQDIPQVFVETTATAVVKYNEANILRVPGNYQDWDVASAPTLVSKNSDGVYEGYANFCQPQTQFYVVKGTAWSNVTTYNELTSNTFGFNGTFFHAREGSGVYRVVVNMNTHTWSCTKISLWMIHGTAFSIYTDAAMVFDANTMTWSVTRNFVKGDFVFQANQSDAISLGHNTESPVGFLDYNGEKIRITENGRYTITLSLQSGNYTYSIKKAA